MQISVNTRNGDVACVIDTTQDNTTKEAQKENVENKGRGTIATP